MKYYYMDNIIGLTVEDAKQLENIIRITSIDGVKVLIDKKHMPIRRNVHIENGRIVFESRRG